MSSQIVVHEMPGIETIAIGNSYDIEIPDDKTKIHSKKRLEKHVLLWLLPGIVKNRSNLIRITRGDK